MTKIEYLNVAIAISEYGLGLLAWINTMTARHSSNLYVISGLILCLGAIIMYLTTGALQKSLIQLVIGLIMFVLVIVARGSIRLR